MPYFRWVSNWIFSRSRPVAMMNLCKLCEVESIITSSWLWENPKYQWMDFVNMEQRDKVKLVINSLQTPNLFIKKWWMAAILNFFNTDWPNSLNNIRNRLPIPWYPRKDTLHAIFGVKNQNGNFHDAARRPFLIYAHYANCPKLPEWQPCSFWCGTPIDYESAIKLHVI